LDSLSGGFASKLSGVHQSGSPSFSVQQSGHMSYKAGHENRIEALHDAAAAQVPRPQA
jgi:hypothetical protein